MHKSHSKQNLGIIFYTVICTYTFYFLCFHCSNFHFTFPPALYQQRKYSAKVIIYSVYRELGKLLPGATLNLKTR